MKLTDYEQRLLSGEFGDDAKKLIEIVVKICEINKIEEFVEVQEVMVASTQNMSIGGVLGMEFLERLAQTGIKFKVKTITTTTPVS